MEDLNKYNFSSKTGFNSVLLKLRYQELSTYFVGKTCLELGSADGEGTKILSNYFDRIVAVDGSDDLINKAKDYVSSDKVEFINSYFEDLRIEEQFDTVILAHILEHVDDPVHILKIAKKYVKENGVILIDVPNAKSLHRQLGVELGMIQTIYTLNEADYSIGHKRVYDLESLSADVLQAGLTIESKGGIFLKLLSNSQMEQMFDINLIHALNELGKKHYDIAAEIYIIGRK